MSQNANRKLELLDAAGRVTQYLRPGRRTEVVFTTPAAGRLTAVGQYRGHTILLDTAGIDRYPILDTGIVRTLLILDENLENIHKEVMSQSISLRSYSIMTRTKVGVVRQRCSQHLQLSFNTF